MVSFGQQFKILRRETGLSQAYIAEQIGVSVQSVSNWECDNTMPDISQIVPLAAILQVSTDCLLGVGMNESADQEELEKQIQIVWANESVNSVEQNADYSVYTLCRDFLKKYPLNDAVKYLCAKAVYDYLLVSSIRHKFEIAEKEFNRMYAECERMLRSICNHDMNSQRQIEARELWVKLLLLKKEWSEAESVAAEIPTLCGMRENVLRNILQQKGELEQAKIASEKTCKIRGLGYVSALYDRARCISNLEGMQKEQAFFAWKEMEDAAKAQIRLFRDNSDLAVNAYENNPYCYLITAYASQCTDHLIMSDMEHALECVEHATDAAIELYT